MCVKKPPCKETDYYAYYGECDRRTLTRIKTYKWKEPTICDSSTSVSVKLPSPEEIKCRGCGRGEHRNMDTN